MWQVRRAEPETAALSRTTAQAAARRRERRLVVPLARVEAKRSRQNVTFAKLAGVPVGADGYDKDMRIGIVGTGSRAIAIGRLFASGGHDVRFSDPRDRAAAKRAAAEIGAIASIPYTQAMRCRLLVLACDRDDVDAALDAMGSGVASGVLDALEGGPTRPHQGVELIAHKMDTHRIVRALIVVPQAGATIPICGDNELTKQLVRDAFAACGCHVTDRGPLSNAQELEPLGTAVAETRTPQAAQSDAQRAQSQRPAPSHSPSVARASTAHASRASLGVTQSLRSA